MHAKRVSKKLKISGLLVLAVLAGCTKPVELLWTFDTNAPVYATPTLFNDLVVFGNEGGDVYAIDKSGTFRWKFSALREVYATPKVAKNIVVFGSTNNIFYALDVRKGLELWRYVTGDRIKSDPVTDGNTVYFSSYDGHVYAAELETGKLQWVFPPLARDGDKPTSSTPPLNVQGAGAHGEPPAPAVEDIKPADFSYSSPILADGTLFLGNMDSYVYAIDAKTGQLRWRFKTGDSPTRGVTSTGYYENGILYIGSNDTNLYAINTKSEKPEVKWVFKTGAEVQAPVLVQGGAVYVGGVDKNFYAVDAQTGKEKWHFKSNGILRSFPAVYQNLVFFGAGQGDGNVYAIDTSSGKLFWKFQTGYKIESDPVVEGDHLYVTSGDRKVYAFKINKTTK